MADNQIIKCECGAKLSIPESKIGKKVRCPKCSVVFVASLTANSMAAEGTDIPKPQVQAEVSAGSEEGVISEAAPPIPPEVSVPSSASSKFDLNIEEVLENWETHHAIREIIANALDEQLLTNTTDIRIRKDIHGNWHINDFGRGLEIDHFTQNEDPEKLESKLPIIGKFGVGLKDALATFHRRGVKVMIYSKHGRFRLGRAAKHGFNDIVTLHVEFDDSSGIDKGTEFVFSGVTDEDMERAKSLFLRFSNDRVFDSNQYGQILERDNDCGRVYILGVFAAEEPNFLFSYNVTNLTVSMKKKLNRERLNVGRTTYSDRIKSILRNSESTEVHAALVDEVRKRAYGDQCDEMNWIEISQFALNLMHQSQNVAYVTEEELQTRGDLLSHAKDDGYNLVVIDEQQKAKLLDQAASGGPEVRILEVYAEEYNESFQYDFVPEEKLSNSEQCVFRLADRILKSVGINPSRFPQVFVSTTIRATSDDAAGVWDSNLRAIVIRRQALSSVKEFASTLLHEAAHVESGATDQTRAFEWQLCEYLGQLAKAALV